MILGAITVLFATAVAQNPLADYVRSFNATDEELYTNAIPNVAAEAFLSRNVPIFTCPDKDVERTYYFRWWTLRKHLRHDLGCWTMTEFLPNVRWSGIGNTIVCPAGHHLRESRWLRDPQYAEGLARFWLADPRSTNRWGYVSWLFTGVRLVAEVSGGRTLEADLLDDAVKYYEAWEKGFVRWGTCHLGGDGKGGFLSLDGFEGTEISLGGHGYRPLMSSAMWSEANAISEAAAQQGRADLAAKFAAKAEAARRSLFERCWNSDVAFFTTAPSGKGPKGSVRELHGYASWYFNMPTDGRRPDWSQLADPQGFAAKYGLTFPERRAKGFVIDYKGHECKWNGPSWPFATSIALTALMNDLHAHPSDSVPLFGDLVHQYAAQHVLKRPDGTTVPWIDENLNPDTGEWLARAILVKRGSRPRERGKDYNHSTFCDLVISGLVGFVPGGDGKFAVDPLCPAEWDCFTLENLRYHGHDVSIRWQRGKGLSVEVDGKAVARRDTLGRLDVRY